MAHYHRIATSAATVSMAFGVLDIAVGFQSPAEAQGGAYVLTKCYVVKSGGQQVAIPAAATFPACKSAADKCVPNDPGKQVHFTEPAVAVVDQNNTITTCNASM